MTETESECRVAWLIAARMYDTSKAIQGMIDSIVEEVMTNCTVDSMFDGALDSDD